MKRSALFLLFFAALPCLAVTKNWKGPAPEHRFVLGMMAGVGVLDSKPGFSLPVTASLKVLDKGFAEDINNQVFVEIQGGPLFVTGSTAFQYSTHLRWDFIKDADWSFYAIGGIGGIASGAALGTRSVFYPRFGIGALWHLFEYVSLRAELSHEFMGVGAMLLL